MNNDDEILAMCKATHEAGGPCSWPPTEHDIAAARAVLLQRKFMDGPPVPRTQIAAAGIRVDIFPIPKPTCLPADAPPAPSPGLYRHYRGGLYLVLCVAETHNHNGDLDVVYASMERGAWRIRPVWRDSRNEDSWNDTVEWPDGQMRRRFLHECDETKHMFEGP